ncbi:MAG: hypothetical protein MJ211_11645 [Bacteroidales bacterium]|nr:hypothetical protein [Bacteroidales bacterium]
MNNRFAFLLFFPILFLCVSCNNRDNHSQQDNIINNNKFIDYQICDDSLNIPSSETILSKLFPNYNDATVSFASRILVDSSKLLFIELCHDYYIDLGCNFCLIDHYLLSENNGDISIKNQVGITDTTLLAPQDADYDFNSKFVKIGPNSVALLTNYFLTNQSFSESMSLKLFETNKLSYLFGIETSFDNIMWNIDAPESYNNVVEIIPSNKEFYDLKVTHNNFEVKNLNTETFDYDLIPCDSSVTNYVFSNLELQYVEQ